MRIAVFVIALISPTILFAQNNDGIAQGFFSVNFWTLLFGVALLAIAGVLVQLNKKFLVLRGEIKVIKGKNTLPGEPMNTNIIKQIETLRKDVDNIGRNLKSKTTAPQQGPNRPAQSPPVPASPPVITAAPVVPITEETAPVIELKVPEKPKQEVFYMATPNEDGSFEVSSRSDEFRATQSLYQFVINSNDTTKASFTFYSDEAGIRDAVNYPHTYIAPVCEPDNALNQNARQILTIQPGLAEKRNTRWIVTQKTKIRYQ